jgi:hypothetical protein
MIGVVLWADACDHKAVIWCEDHGNLAYYSAPEQTAHEGESLDAGDLIAFDMREERDCRMARNPRRVNAGYAPALAQNLAAVRRSAVARARPEHAAGDNVVAFPSRAG